MVGHIAMFATPIAAELLKKRWISIALQPAIFFSATDPPYFPPFGPLPRISPVIARSIFAMVRGITARWIRPVQMLRRELGLPPYARPFSAISSRLGARSLVFHRYWQLHSRIGPPRWRSPGSQSTIS